MGLLSLVGTQRATSPANLLLGDDVLFGGVGRLLLDGLGDLVQAGLA